MAKAKKLDKPPKPAKADRATMPVPATTAPQAPSVTSTMSTTLTPKTTPAPAKLGKPTGTIPATLKIAYGRGMPWSNVTQDAPLHEKYGNPYGIAAMLMAIEVIEAGGQMIWNTSGSGAYGIMQIKEANWGWLAKQLGVSLQTREGQVAVAAAILGKEGKGANPRERFLYSYYPVVDNKGKLCLDCKGEDGATPRQYLADMDALIQIINAAGSGTSPAEPQGDVIDLLFGGKPYAISAEYGQPVTWECPRGINPGRPGNCYEYQKSYGLDDVHHWAYDVSAAAGDGAPLYAPFNGSVVCAGTGVGSGAWGTGCDAFDRDNNYGGKPEGAGNGRLEILNADGTASLIIGHVLSSRVRAGDRVKAGDLIGQQGGMNASHVHLECRYANGTRIGDPRKLFGDASLPTETRPMVRFAGTSVDVPLSVPLRVVLMPTTQRNQRPGTKMTPDRFIVHETDNQSASANAAMHLRWLQQGAPDDFGRSQQLSFHLVVDENEVIQMIPFDEIAWHGGDGAGGVCNTRGLSIEITVANKNANKAKIRANAEEVVAAAMLAKNLTLLERHGDCCARLGNPSGCHVRCPATMQADIYWPTFKARVDAWRFGATPAPQYAAPVTPPEWDGTDKVVNGITFWAAERTYTAKQDGVPALKYADRTSAPVRPPLSKGEAFTGQYLVNIADEQWIVTPFGTRIPAELCTPLVKVTP